MQSQDKSVLSNTVSGKSDPAAGLNSHSATPWVEDENCTDDVDNMVACLLAGKGTAHEWVAIGIEDADGYAESVAYCHPDNAPLIVRACNAHEELVKIAESAKTAIAGLLETDDDGHPSDHALHLARCAVGDLNVALAKAGAQ